MVSFQFVHQFAVYTCDVAGIDKGGINVGFIFQQYNLIPKLTVLENVELPLLYAGVSLKERRARAVEALNAVGLGERIHFRPNQLSGGQCQRLALARALLHDSPVYIFDEATSNIDVESENEIMTQIHRLAKSKTVILISHRLANVAGADNIYVMDGGSVVESGSHRALVERGGAYAKLWNAQQELESYAKGGEEE